MEFFANFYNALFDALGTGLWALAFFMITIGAVAQWRLYEKANLPGYHSLVPVQNLITFLKIVGRPSKQAWLFLIPVYNIFFTVIVYKELCNSFGKRTLLDHFLILVFNGLYVLNLGLSYNTVYYGPTYNLSEIEISEMIATYKKAHRINSPNTNKVRKMKSHKTDPYFKHKSLKRFAHAS